MVAAHITRKKNRLRKKNRRVRILIASLPSAKWKRETREPTTPVPITTYVIHQH
jgi:hypothetical protein